VGRHAEGVGGTVTGLHGAALQPLATGDGIVGGQTTPGTAGCLVRPLAPRGADGRENRLGDGGADPVDGHEVHARHPEEGRAGGVGRGVHAVRMGLAGRWGRARGPGCCGGRCATRLHDREAACDRRVACAAWGGGAIAERQGVREDKERRRTPSAGQRVGPRVALLLAAGVPQGRAGTRGALARANGADDTWPRGARHLAERVG